MIDLKQKNAFSRLLLSWNATLNTRELAWKYERNPYYIWLSEIILQQTRAAQGLPYYLKFKTTYPTVFDLADAPLNDVLRLWQGLGYYSRARNLHKAANQVVGEFGGVFPKKHTELLELTGVGDYTASAISSFAYDEPNAVLDGNVIRVLSRFFGIEEPFDTNGGKKLFRNLAQELLADNPPASYNQAIMDFGAIICTPQKPLCDDCPLQKMCFAFKQDLVAHLPVKSKKTAIRNRYFNYLLLQKEDKILISQRLEKDIWQGLWQLPMVETSQSLQAKAKELAGLFNLKPKAISFISAENRQLLSHQKIHAIFIETKSADYSKKESEIWVTVSSLQRYAFPKTLLFFLKEKGYF